jgi:LppP/LprE lipoprotein
VVGVLATLVLLGIGVAIAAMVLPGSGTDTTAATGLNQPATASHGHKSTAAKPKPAGLTPAQKHARSAAVASLRGVGYAPVKLSDYDPHHALRVLVGRRTGANPQALRRAFFFSGGHAVGSDSPEPSSALKVAGAGKDWVTLAYGIYSPGDQPCCPTGGHVKVRYGLSGGAVSAVGGTLPPSTSRVSAG